MRYGSPVTVEPSSPPDRSGAHRPSRMTLARHERRLLGQEPALTLAQLAEQAGTDTELARRFWRAMGFADVPDDEVTFTQADVDALVTFRHLVDVDGGLDLTSALEVLRAQSFTMDRLVLWELEALVAYVARRYRLDDTSARLVALDRVDGIVDVLHRQLDYAWSRHMVGLLRRTETEVASRGREETGPGLYPLTRSLGFVDIVSFTQRAQTMGSAELRDMLDDFENTARDVVTSRGARVVKTIGDAVMYIADDVRTGADVVTALVSALQRRPMMRVRASLVQGRVVSRSGDVFGPPVNLASRLVDAAEPGGIRMDTATARAIMEGPDAERYRVRECHEIVAKGLGNIVPWSLELAPGVRARASA